MRQAENLSEKSPTSSQNVTSVIVVNIQGLRSYTTKKVLPCLLTKATLLEDHIEVGLVSDVWISNYNRETI